MNVAIPLGLIIAAQSLTACVDLTVPLFFISCSICFIVGFLTGKWVREHEKRQLN